MVSFVVENPGAGVGFETDFEHFIEIVKGTTIVSAAVSDDFLELGITENFNLRIERDFRGALQVRLFSTLNRGEPSAIRLRLISAKESPTAALVEQRIRAVRQVYAIALLLDTNRQKVLADFIGRGADSDIESSLLKPAERLRIQAAGPGSFWVTVIPKTKAGFFAVTKALALLTSEGRETFLRTIRASADLRELEVEERRVEIGKSRINGILDTIKKVEEIGDPEIRAKLKESLITNFDSLGSDVRAALPAPKRRANASATRGAQGRLGRPPGK